MFFLVNLRNCLIIFVSEICFLKLSILSNYWLNLLHQHWDLFDFLVKFFEILTPTIFYLINHLIHICSKLLDTNIEILPKFISFSRIHQYTFIFFMLFSILFRIILVFLVFASLLSIINNLLVSCSHYLSQIYL